MTNLTIRTEPNFQKNITEPICLFHSYTIRSWTPLKVKKSETPLQLRVSEVKSYFCAKDKSIFKHEILVPDPHHENNLGYCWSIYSLACQSLIKTKDRTKEDLKDFYTLLAVIREYSKTNQFSSELDLLLLGLVYYNLAFCRMYGIGIEKNNVKALKNFRAASKFGIKQASQFIEFINQLNLNTYLHKKKIIFKDKIAANQNNDMTAQYRLGLRYLKKALTKGQTLNKAIYYFQQAADNGHQKAQYQMALFYSTGSVLQKDILKTFYYYCLAAAQGYTRAQNNLGCLYFQGTECPLNYKKAYKLFKLAASREFPLAHRNLGNCFLNGLGVERNILKALEHFEKYEFLAPEESKIEYLSYQCKVHLAIAYQTGDGAQKNMKKAFDLFTSLADEVPQFAEPRKMYYQICHRLGSLYQNGYVDQTLILSIDLKKAIGLYQKARLEQSASTYELATYARTGLRWQGETLVPKNLRRYVELLKQAAKKGLHTACYELATLYEHGFQASHRITLIRPNLKKAIYYYTRAERQTDADRCFSLRISAAEGQCT